MKPPAHTLLALGLLLAGCAAPPVDLSPQDRAAIRTANVEISKGPTQLEQVFISGAAATYPYPSMIGSGHRDEFTKSFTATMPATAEAGLLQALQYHHIEPNALLAEAFTNVARERAPFAITRGPADATFKLHLRRVGFMIPIHQRLWVATYVAAVELVKKDGTVAWSTWTANTSDQFGQLRDFAADPAFLRRSMARAAEMTSLSLFALMRGEREPEVNYGAAARQKREADYAREDALDAAEDAQYEREREARRANQAALRKPHAAKPTAAPR